MKHNDEYPNPMFWWFAPNHTFGLPADSATDVFGWTEEIEARCACFIGG